jgi:hypothetical protein
MTGGETATGSLGLQPVAAADDSEHSDVDIDIDIDIHLQRMSTDALAVLDSLRDEMAELSRDSSSRKLGGKSPRSRSSSSSSEGELKEETMPHSDNHGMALKDLKRTKGDDSSLNLSGTFHDRDNDDDDGVSDDESITRELGALSEVTREIERELKSQDADSMRDAISRIESSADKASLRKQLMGSDDKEIIRKILEDEMKQDPPSNPIEGFIHAYGLYGPGAGGQDLNYPLLAGAVAVWAVVIGLLVQVMNYDI